MPFPDFEFKKTIEGENNIELSSVRDALIKANQLNFSDINFGAIRPGAGSVIDGNLIVDGSILATKIVLSGINTSELNNDAGWTDTGDLGDLAYEDAVEKAKLGTTVIDGGYLVTGLINASRIDTGTLSADRLSVTELNALNIKAGSVDAEDITGNTITGKTIVGSTLTTASSGSRVEIGTGVAQRVDFYIGSSFIGGVQSDSVGASDFITIYGNTDNFLNLNSGVHSEDATLSGDYSVGIRAGSDIRLYADTVEFIGTRLTMSGTSSNRSYLRPDNADGSNLGTSTYYWHQMYADIVRYKDLDSFDHIEDIEAIKKIKTKTIEIEEDEDEGKKKKKRKKMKKEVWDPETLPKDVHSGGFFNAGSVSGLTIGALKELITKVESLERQLQELKNNV